MQVYILIFFELGIYTVRYMVALVEIFQLCFIYEYNEYIAYGIYGSTIAY